jgi:hypothetical protein
MMKVGLFTIALTLTCVMTLWSQSIRPPGYEREVQAMEERMRTSVLEQDSCIVIDTVLLFDPVSYEETMRIVSSSLSWKDYCNFRLGINKPDELLNGQPMTITDPATYGTITVQWNAVETKLDTISRQ